MTNNENDVIEALKTIKQMCVDRKHICKDCPLSNMNDECLVYEYPYLWQVKLKKIVKYLSDK